MPGEGLTHGPPAEKSRRQSPQDQPTVRHSLRDGVNAYTSSPRGPAFLPPSLARSPKRRKLGISTGMPGPHDFAVRRNVSRLRLATHLTSRRPSHCRSNVRDDAYVPHPGPERAQHKTDFRIFGSDLFFAEPLETSHCLGIAGEMSVMVRADLAGLANCDGSPVELSPFDEPPRQFFDLPDEDRPKTTPVHGLEKGHEVQGWLEGTRLSVQAERPCRGGRPRFRRAVRRRHGGQAGGNLI